MAHPFYYFCRFGCRDLGKCAIFKKAARKRQGWSEIAPSCPKWRAKQENNKKQ